MTHHGAGRRRSRRCRCMGVRIIAAPPGCARGRGTDPTDWLAATPASSRTSTPRARLHVLALCSAPPGERGTGPTPVSDVSSPGSLPGPLSYGTTDTFRLFHGLSHGFRSRCSPDPLAPLRFGRLRANPRSAFGRSVGLGATPRRTCVLRPGNPALVTPVVSWSGSLPARADGATHPCGKASGPACGGSRWWPAMFPKGVRSSQRRRGSSDNVADAALDLAGPLLGVREPEDLRRAEASCPVCVPQAATIGTATQVTPRHAAAPGSPRGWRARFGIAHSARAALSRIARSGAGRRR